MLLATSYRVKAHPYERRRAVTEEARELTRLLGGIGLGGAGLCFLADCDVEGLDGCDSFDAASFNSGSEADTLR